MNTKSNGLTPPPQHLPVSKIAPFVTPEEIAQARKFEEQLKRLDRQFISLHVTELEKCCVEAHKTYRDSPTDENLRAYRNAAIEVAVTEKLLPAEVVATVDGVKQKFIEREILPWCRPILGRGLDNARAALNALIESERARHKELTGENLSSDNANAIIALARIPVTTLERFVSATNVASREAMTRSTAGEIRTSRREGRRNALPILEFLCAHALGG
jgi:hypothetical protein